MAGVLPALLFTVAAPIIGGSDAPDDAAVVLLVSYPPDRSTWYTCTATVVAPTVLLTAAHCVDAPNHPGFLYGAFLGADASGYPSLAALEADLVPIAEVHAHPDYDPGAPFHADLGVAILGAVVEVAPVPLWRDPVTAALIDRPARIVGYGQAQLGVPSATRRQAATVVAGLDADDTVRVGDPAHVTCLGDSGGPALVEVDGVEHLLGVDSYADNSSCDQPAHFRRADVYAAWIDGYTGGEPAGPDAGVTPGDDAGADGGGCNSGGGAASPLLLAGVALLASRLRRQGRYSAS